MTIPKVPIAADTRTGGDPLFIGGRISPGKGATPAGGQLAQANLAGAAAKDFDLLFANIRRATEAVRVVMNAAYASRHRSEAFIVPLRGLVMLGDNVDACLDRIRHIFVESAEEQAILGKPPTRTTVNLRHFSICATVTRRLHPRRFGAHSRCAARLHSGGGGGCRGRKLIHLPHARCLRRANPLLSVYICVAHTCAVHCMCRTLPRLRPTSTRP